MKLRERAEGIGERGRKRETYSNTHCRLLMNSMIDFDLRTVGVVARTASMLLLCTSSGRDESSSAKREKKGGKNKEKISKKHIQQNKIRTIFIFFCLFFPSTFER